MLKVAKRVRKGPASRDAGCPPEPPWSGAARSRGPAQQTRTPYASRPSRALGRPPTLSAPLSSSPASTSTATHTPRRPLLQTPLIHMPPIKARAL